MKQRGFTLIELLIAISLFTIMLSISLSYVNMTQNLNTTHANCLATQMRNIELSLTNYQSAKGGFPDADNTTCPTYPVELTENCLPAFIPSYLLGSPRTNACCEWAVPYYRYYNNNSIQVYICMEAIDIDQNQWTVLKRIQEKENEGKVYLNTSCGATSNLSTPLPSSPPSGSIFLTWWVR